MNYTFLAIMAIFGVTGFLMTFTQMTKKPKPPIISFDNIKAFLVIFFIFSITLAIPPDMQFSKALFGITASTIYGCGVAYISLKLSKLK